MLPCYPPRLKREKVDERIRQTRSCVVATLEERGQGRAGNVGCQGLVRVGIKRENNLPYRGRTDSDLVPSGVHGVGRSAYCAGIRRADFDFEGGISKACVGVVTQPYAIGGRGSRSAIVGTEASVESSVCGLLKLENEIGVPIRVGAYRAKSVGPVVVSEFDVTISTSRGSTSDRKNSDMRP